MNTLTDLKQQWEDLKANQPKIRIRNAAKELGVSEMELLATQLGDNVTKLKPEFAAILQEIESLGKVMALTRNNECVHERKGIYLNPDFSSPHAQLFVGEDIDMRIFLNHWKTAFAVVEKSEHGERKSLQFFGKDGEAIHKIYLVPQSNVEAFDALVEKYKDEDQQTIPATEIIENNVTEKPDNEIEVEGFQQAWVELKDTHNFFMMLRKFGVTRTQALRLAPTDYHAKQISNEAIVQFLEKSTETQTPIMVFTGNKGNIQIHTGEIKRTMWHENWFNILDPDFNMHLDMSKIASTWIVRKPTEDGIVTAIEVFNDKGEIIVQFFGKRKPGIPELEQWREIVAELN
ncbi:hemin-degrading factor [Empedobacter falsenii]|uniref:Hemin-degrading factor n=1 Tax=Empedobacter falsenii TaxID=343874 RepID=A0AAW7DIC0_9FLAO|nr:ChuX/HutX family heme-like substrate-binding protein [Empedobacter falsenii]MDM1551575.1 hemin-degrading factor [Empedobacter falsenii]